MADPQSEKPGILKMPGFFRFAVDPACRAGFSPQGEPARCAINKTGQFWRISCDQVAASREIPLGKRDLLELQPGKQNLLERHTT